MLCHVTFSNIFNNIIHTDLKRKTLPVRFEHQPIYFLVDAFQPNKEIHIPMAEQEGNQVCLSDILIFFFTNSNSFHDMLFWFKNPTTQNRFDVVKQMNIKTSAFWDVTPCSLMDQQCFRVTYCLDLQGSRDGGSKPVLPTHQ
jgi:hypothetical protein